MVLLIILEILFFNERFMVLSLALMVEEILFFSIGGFKPIEKKD